MTASYTEAHRKYYQKHKDTIYRKQLKYKLKYNKEYYNLHKEEINKRARERRHAKKQSELFKAISDAQ